MRVRRKWNLDVDVVPSDSLIKLGGNTTVRVVKFDLPSGEQETDDVSVVVVDGVGRMI